MKSEERRMKNERHYNNLFIPFLLSLALIAGCRKELPVLDSEKEFVTYPTDPRNIEGFFLLNEGNMGSNKCTIDFFSARGGYYLRNIYPESNPGIVKELGDVGNDIQIHDGKLYVVVNCSHLVEVMDARTARHLGSVNITNCRYITFNGDKAYVSSYAGPVQIDPEARPGKVVEFDTNTFQITREVVVGYQPEEMVITGGRLYVANSGGYRYPDYDHTVSVIDLESFQVVNTIDVAINLHRMEKDTKGNIYVTSRGDYYGNGSDIYVIDTATGTVTGNLGIPANEMCLDGDSLYILSSSWNHEGENNETGYFIYDTAQKRLVSENFITDGTDKEIQLPYGIAVNPETKEIYVSDATDYVTPGYLHCFTPDGKKQWSVRTGDIPAHFAFTTEEFYYNNTPQETTSSAYITKVIEYMPAPGQFVNVMPKYEEGDTPDDMNRKALEAIGNNKRGMVSLGGYGGYIIVGFDHRIENRPGLRDFRVLGNAFEGAATAMGGGGYEPGIIQVALDEDKDGKADGGVWYEIAGSAHRDATQESWYETARNAGTDTLFYHGDYEIVYHAPKEEQSGNDNIRWEDNKGNQGHMTRNMYHSQPYYPQWITEQEMRFKGSRLPQNGIDESGQGTYYVLYPFAFGYADNAPNTSDGSTIDIDWAVDAEGNEVSLPGIDLIRIYTGVNQQNGWIGECSTEISGIEDLHVLGVEITSEQASGK